MQLVLSWPIRIIVVGLLVFSLFVDGAGYIYRISNHLPLAGSVPGLPPNFSGWQLYVHKGLDLAGGTQLELQLSNFPAGRDRATLQQQTIDVITKRVNALGVNEPVVEPAGTNHDRVIVQLAGVSSSQAYNVIGRTAQLITTKWVPDASITNGPYPGFKPQITPLKSDMLTGANASLDQSTGTAWVVNVTFNSQGAAEFGSLTTAAYNALSACGTASSCPQNHITEWLDLTQADINNWNTDAAQLYQPASTGSGSAGGKLVTDPVIQQAITGGQAVISGTFTQQSAKDLATLLNSGSLPVAIHVVQSTDVGASLGLSSIKESLAAGLLGLIIVIIFMVAFYRLPGLLASAALLFYGGVVLAVFKVVPVTLTLAGIAGFILSVGMAVDANVLIFERFKEELRAGRTIGAGVEAAVRRAWPAIRDSNISTLITSVVLIFFGSGSVKGFAVVLAIGVLASLVSSIIVTHNLLSIVLNFGWARSDGLLGVHRGRIA
ncbi:MAG TPA: protein translocase subunit SecD [Candidatus Acidoferrales bacterium]|nr:protein translocase subunit SecD [Candidatus Acidoferrales bacterium]